MRRAVLLLVLLPLLAPFAPASALAQASHREGVYGGVAPGGAAGEPDDRRSAATRRALRGTLSWLGFAAPDRGAQVFFQSAAPFEVQQRLEGDTLVVHLDLTRMATNTGRPIDTRFFENPLARITARKVRAARASKGRAGHPAGIEVRIAFKNASDAREGQLRAETGPDGLHYVFLAFPPGSAAAPQPTLGDPDL